MVGREGVEPPKAKLVDLQSTPFGHSGICPFKKNLELIFRYSSKFFFIISMEPIIGFEPMTVRLQGECSTSWAMVAQRCICEKHIIKKLI